MTQQLALSTLIVREYDEAIDFFVRRLGFILRDDRQLSAEKHWVVVAPTGSVGGLLLAKAVGERQLAAVGNQVGGRVSFFLHTDDFGRDHGNMQANGIRFFEEPRSEDYGSVAVFEDLYGNRWDLIGPTNEEASA